MKIEIFDYAHRGKKYFPSRAKPMDAGADVYAQTRKTLEPNETYKFSLGFGVKIPNGYVGFVFPRSSLSALGIVCQLPPIDASYMGVIHAVVTNTSDIPHTIHEGDRIGQLVILPCVIADFVTGPLEERRDSGFGSTGK